MKVTTKITTPPPVPQPAAKLDTVTIELTGSEAYLLTRLVGAMTQQESNDLLQKPSYTLSGLVPNNYETLLKNSHDIIDRLFNYLSDALIKAAEQTNGKL